MILPSDFFGEINTLRKRNKNGWYFYSGQVAGKKVRLKGFGTWLQIYQVDGIDYSNPMSRKVSQFHTDLIKPFGG